MELLVCVFVAMNRERKLDVMKTEIMDMLESVSLIRERKWENLESNILLKIVSRVPLNDLCWNVSSVCRSWQSVCWDLMFWNQDKLDLRIATPGCSKCNMLAAKTTNLYNLGLTPDFSLPKQTNVVDAKLMSLLCSIMEGEDVYGHPLEEWRLSIRKILVPCDLAISDQHLIYIAERSPLGIELIIDNASRITPAGLLRALSHWQCIERIHLESVDSSCRKEIKELIRENCETIKKLHVSSPIKYIDFYEQLCQWA